MSTNTILVVGGTGLLGGATARRLNSDGYAVRVLTRNVERDRGALGPDFTYIAGDLDDSASLERALDGCMGVHIGLRGDASPTELDRVEHQGPARIARLAAHLGLTRLTHISGGLVNAASAARFPGQQAKLAAEQAIEQSGVPYTIFKPTYVMDTLPRHIQGGMAIVLGRQPHPLHMIAAADLAALISCAFRTPEAANRHLFARGPEAITILDALRLYCSIVARGKRIFTLPLWFMNLIDTVFMHQRMRVTLDVMRQLQQVGEMGDAAETSRLLGTSTTTVRQWCEQQRA